MIAAFTDDNRDEDLGEILTQEQAVRVKHLINRHSIHPAGWFKSRKVAAVSCLRPTRPVAPKAARARRTVAARLNLRLHAEVPYQGLGLRDDDR